MNDEVKIKNEHSHIQFVIYLIEDKLAFQFNS
jgi:hypothetical protein